MYPAYRIYREKVLLRGMSAKPGKRLRDGTTLLRS